MKDHLFESGFRVVRSMVDRILADKCRLHEAVLNSSLIHFEKLLQRKESITEKDRGGRIQLHVAVSCCSPKIIQPLLERRADINSVDIFLGLSPVQYAIGMADYEMLSLLMEKGLTSGNKCALAPSVIVRTILLVTFARQHNTAIIIC
jgi:ankyrin repeat protein